MPIDNKSFKGKIIWSVNISAKGRIPAPFEGVNRKSNLLLVWKFGGSHLMPANQQKN